MKDMIIQTYANDNIQKVVFNNSLEVEIEITKNKYNIPVKSLFEVAARNNKKRKFLFVSKLLGKHIPVHPSIPSIGGRLLATLLSNQSDEKKEVELRIGIDAINDYCNVEKAMNYYNNNKLVLDEDTLFVGFAETATGLGHSMFEAFSKNASFVHTTRDYLKELKSAFSFEEVHSHDVDHMCYIEKDDFINKNNTIVLVDDEITTGNTASNLIKTINEKYPSKKYVIASILDWRSKEDIGRLEKFKKENNIDISFISLIEGTVRSVGDISIPANEHIIQKKSSISMNTVKLHLIDKEKYIYLDGFKDEKVYEYFSLTGRFGLCSKDKKSLDEYIEEAGKKLIGCRMGGPALCLGFNELIYIPSKISEKMGENILFQTTTRSPIHFSDSENYCIKSAITFKNPYDLYIQNYLYNINFKDYQQVFLFLERDIDSYHKETISELVSNHGVKDITFVIL